MKKILLLCVFILLSFITHSQEYVSDEQTIYLFGNGVIKATNHYNFIIKGLYVQQTNRKRLKVINVFDLNVEITDKNTVSRMTFNNNSEKPYLEYITIDLFTQNTARFVYYLKLEK